jgi:hypothetical protein
MASWAARIVVEEGALVAEEGARIRTARHVPAGRDQFRGKNREVFGSRVIDTKVSTLDTDSGLSVSEIVDVEKGGPARHLHHEQEPSGSQMAKVEL